MEKQICMNNRFLSYLTLDACLTVIDFYVVFF